MSTRSTQCCCNLLGEHWHWILLDRYESGLVQFLVEHWRWRYWAVSWALRAFHLLWFLAWALACQRERCFFAYWSPGESGLMSSWVQGASGMSSHSSLLSVSEGRRAGGWEWLRRPRSWLICKASAQVIGGGVGLFRCYRGRRWPNISDSYPVKWILLRLIGRWRLIGKGGGCEWWGS